MKDWLALRPLVVMLILLAFVLAGFVGLVFTNNAQAFIPAPDTVVDQFVDALSAHRYAGAMNQLSQDLQQSTSQEDLQAWVDRIKQGPAQGIEHSDSVGAQERGQNGTGKAKVILGSGQTVEVEFPVVKENGLWKLDALEPLEVLAGGG